MSVKTRLNKKAPTFVGALESFNRGCICLQGNMSWPPSISIFSGDQAVQRLKELTYRLTGRTASFSSARLIRRFQ